MGNTLLIDYLHQFKIVVVVQLLSPVWLFATPCTPVFLLGKSHRQRSLADYSPWGCKEADMTERLSTHTQTTHI